MENEDLIRDIKNLICLIKFKEERKHLIEDTRAYYKFKKINSKKEYENIKEIIPVYFFAFKNISKINFEKNFYTGENLKKIKDFLDEYLTLIIIKEI